MKLSQQMTFLGMAALIYYAVLLAMGVLSAAVMPQFLVTAVIFLSSGRLIRNGARRRTEEDDADESKKKPKAEPNWALRTQLLNWGMTALILCVLGIWVMKPVGVSMLEFLHIKLFLETMGHEASWGLVSEVPPP